MKDSTTKNREWLYTGLSVIIIIGLWQVLAACIGKEIIMPLPKTVLSQLFHTINQDNFIVSVGYTLARSISGFSVAFALALILGVLSGFFNIFYYLLKPVIVVTKAIPTMGVILLALIWLESEKAPIFVGFLIIFPILYENIVQGIRSVDPKLIEMVKLYEINPVKVLRNVYIPSISSYISAGAASAIALNLKTIIAAEVLSQPKISIGINFQIEKANLNTAGVFAWSIVAIVLAALLEVVFKIIKKCKSSFI